VLTTKDQVSRTLNCCTWKGIQGPLAVKGTGAQGYPSGTHLSPVRRVLWGVFKKAMVPYGPTRYTPRPNYQVHAELGLFKLYIIQYVQNC
jgi:hypothetical protein